MKIVNSQIVNAMMNSKNKWSVIINAILTALTTILTGFNVI